jgi:hypothetical protein
VTIPPTLPGLSPIPRDDPWTRPEEPATGGGGSTTMCVWIGLILAVLGGYFIVEPSLPPPTPPPHCNDYRASSWPECNTTRVVNLQRLAAGQTLFLSGAIFLAAAWRPR